MGKGGEADNGQENQFYIYVCLYIYVYKYNMVCKGGQAEKKRLAIGFDCSFMTSDQRKTHQ